MNTNQPPAISTARNEWMRLETAVFQAAGLINLLSAKLVRLIDECETEGEASGMIAAGNQQLSDEIVERLTGAYEEAMKCRYEEKLAAEAISEARADSAAEPRQKGS